MYKHGNTEYLNKFFAHLKLFSIYSTHFEYCISIHE